MKAIEALAILATEDGSPSISRFLIENGRLPFVDDEVKPWAYRGWLIPYLMMCEAHPDIASRYDYVSRTLDAGKLLDEPIPQIDFLDERAPRTKEGMKMLASMVKIADQSNGYTRSFELVAEWLGFALGLCREPSVMKDRDQEQLYRLFDVSKWLLAPTDYLGEYMAEANIGKAAAFFPTPMSICKLMAAMTYGDSDHRLMTAMDCCVGTGRTLLPASNYCLRLYGQDINYICVLVCKINFALYAPWHHFPASFFPEGPAPALVEQPMPAENGLQRPAIAEDTAKNGTVRKPQKIFTTEIEQPSLFGMD